VPLIADDDDGWSKVSRAVRVLKLALHPLT
jgi:hypothetical protein